MSKFHIPAVAPIARGLRAFARETRGTITIEALIILPFYFYFFVAAWSFFDAFRVVSINEKAAYTISDVISRRNAGAPVDRPYIDGLNNVFDHLIEGRGTTWIRVTSVTYDGFTDTYVADWSVATRGNTGQTTASLQSARNQLPVMSNGDNVVLVETFTNYTSPLDSIGASRQLQTFVFTRPRFAPMITYVGA